MVIANQTILVSQNRFAFMPTSEQKTEKVLPRKSPSPQSSLPPSPLSNTISAGTLEPDPEYLDSAPLSEEIERSAPAPLPVIKKFNIKFTDLFTPEGGSKYQLILSEAEEQKAKEYLKSLKEQADRSRPASP